MPKLAISCIKDIPLSERYYIVFMYEWTLFAGAKIITESEITDFKMTQ